MITLALAACRLNNGGSGLGSGAQPDESSGTGSEGPTGGSEGADTTAATTSMPDESADGPPTDEGPSTHPMVTISDGPMFDFGTHDLTEEVDQAFTVTNEGDADATALQVGEPGEGFSIVTHDCSDVLAPQASCEVQVRFVSGRFGDAQGELQIEFQDHEMATTASLSLVGRGVGTTDNLVINGGGELGEATDIPPMGWASGYGPSWSASWLIGKPVEGDRVISAGWGPPGPNTFTLDQQVDIEALTTWGDAEGVRVRYRAFHRSEAMNDDPTWIELRFLDSAGIEMEVYPGSQHSSPEWNESTGDFVLPAGTHSVRLSLQCERMAGDACSGFFDGVELWAEWTG